MKKIAILSASLALAASAFCQAQKIEINPDNAFQKIDNFTAADAWSGNFVGQYFDEAQKGQIAKWLFSQKLGADGNPEGIGLSMWRINVGGGTLEQDGADIGIFNRRAESFLAKDGRSYDWGKCAGQQYFMRKAKEYGCEKFLLFSNTPPVQFTRNGKGYGNKGDSSANLKPEGFAKFADFMADVAKHFKDEGFNIAYISPINEPQMNWSASNNQEGSPWSTPDMYKAFTELDRAMGERNLDNTKMLLGETACLRYIYENKKTSWKSENDELASNNLAEKFFSKGSKYYVGNLKHMPKIIAGHTYHTHLDNKKMAEVRQNVAKACSKYGIDFHQTEWCMLHYNQKNQWGLTQDWFSDNRADIQVALVMARIIYSDFVHANSHAWGYWKGMEIKGDFALTGVYPTNGDITKGGVARANKLLWALGNYSLFVRPDFKRIELKGADDLDTVAATAFASPDSKRIVAVFVNSSFNEYEKQIAIDGNRKTAQVAAYRTDANSDLARVGGEDLNKIRIAPRSITTVVIDLQ